MEICPRRSLPPVEVCLGTNPIHAAIMRPDLNTCGSVIEDASADAVIGPIPGTVSRRRLSSFVRCQAWIRLSAALIDCESFDARYAATSARTGAGIGGVFEQIAQRLRLQSPRRQVLKMVRATLDLDEEERAQRRRKKCSCA